MPVDVREVRGLGLRPIAGLVRGIYEDDPDMVLPWPAARYGRIHRAQSAGSARTFVALRGRSIEGTITVIRDDKHKSVHDEAVVFFGYLEMRRDRDVARALVEAASEAAAAWGARILRGPRNLTRVDETGVLVDSRAPAPMLAGHHRPWYRSYLEELGFEHHHDVLAYDIELFDEDGTARPLPDKLAEAARSVDLPGLEVRSASLTRVRRDLDQAHEVMVEGFRDVPENTPLPRAQFRAMGALLLGFTHPAMLQLATVQREPAGFALCFPELNGAWCHARGRLFGAGGLRFLRGLRSNTTASFKLLGIVPKFRHAGLHAALIARAIEGVRLAGYRRLEASLIDGRNKPMRHIVESSGMEIYRRYRVYDRAIS
jgi:GNAT superfamily N-acetyltransferase